MRLTFIILFFAASIAAQPNLAEPIKIDPSPENFNHLMALKNPSARQIDTLIELSVAYSFTNEDSCLLLGIKSVEMSSGLADQSLHAKALIELGDSYRIFGNLDEAEKLLVKGKAIYESMGNAGQVAHANNILGALNVNRGNHEEAINYYLKALETWEDLKDSQNIIKPYINIGAVFKNINRLDKAELYDLKALALAEILKDDRGKMYVLNNLAIVYNSRAVTYNSIADTIKEGSTVYRDSAQYFIDKALLNYEEALSVAREMNDKRSIQRFLSNMADLKTTMGAYSESIQLSKEAEIISKELGEVSSIIQNKINMSEAYRFMGQYNNAVLYGEEALQLASANAMKKNKAAANEQLFEVYKQLGQYSKALLNLEALKSYTDQNGDIERNKAIAEVESRYQYVQKEKQILEQKNNILELKAVNDKIRTQRNYFVGGGLLLSILAFFGFRLNKVRRERNDKKAFAEALIFAQEEERKRIARDLHDGVGQSLLLIKKQMENTHQSTLENQQLISETLEEVRSISRDLHPFQLEKFGLTTAINDAIRKVSQHTELFITKDFDKIDNLLSDKAEIHIFRTIQEALSNIVKHASATAARISIKADAKNIHITIKDNGKGYDHELQLVKSKSMGLKTMYERISAIGGQLRIESGTPKGTTIDITIPKAINQKQ